MDHEGARMRVGPLALLQAGATLDLWHPDMGHRDAPRAGD